MSRDIDVIKLLQRADKHYLGSGGRLVWAPRFPRHLDAPGFWDAAQYYTYEFRPLFTWTLLSEKAEEIPLRLRSRQWDPSSLTQIYAAKLPHGTIIIKEVKCVLASDVAACEITLRAPAKAKLHLVAWTAQENFTKGDCSLSDLEVKEGAFSFTKRVHQNGRPPFELGAHFALDQTPHSNAITPSQGELPPPQWDLTPFAEKFSGGRLSPLAEGAPLHVEGVHFLALHRELLLSSTKEERLVIALAVSPSPEKSRRQLHSATQGSAPASVSTQSWKEYFQSVPRFYSSDPYLTRYYWYRWYGLRLNGIPGGDARYAHRDVCQGIADSRALVSLSAPSHIRENRWRSDPEFARGSLRNFIANQHEDGSFPGRIDIAGDSPDTIYHSDWGSALSALQAVHPDSRLLREAFEALVRYVRYFDRERDKEGSGLYDILNGAESGQPYSPRSAVLASGSRQSSWGKQFRLKGVDATVYLYNLKRALASAMRSLGKPGEAELWEIEADKIRSAVRARMWNPNVAMFFDVEATSSAQTLVSAPSCFTPYATDIVAVEHLEGLKRHLFSQSEFFPAYPVPSTPLDSGNFSAEAEWENARMDCPWNGRVYPAANSQIAEALAHCATAFEDVDLRRKTAEFISRYIRMMFFDAKRPNCFEHYNPITGKPSLYRGIDDYQHSWVVDLIITYVCGIRIEGSDLVVDPFPFALEKAAIDNLLIQGVQVKVDISGKKFSLWMDGVKKAESTLGRPVRVALN
ncbi:MAG TPA: trehalase family glycosidase [Bacteroidota bacterium]|nr:trehalase family glycosidase [Bacteroidota bacterium]